MKIIDESGNLILLNPDGISTVVANVIYGHTYGSVSSSALTTPCLTIYTKNRSLEDKFIFCDDNAIPFTHLQSKLLNPILMKIYQKLLLNNNYYNVEKFLAIIISDYFIDYLGYSLSDFTPLSEDAFID